MQVALAWLLQRAPNILLIPGTSSIGHLRENLRPPACGCRQRRRQH
jgi:pyridoxine 4-dehydrogenase